MANIAKIALINSEVVIAKEAINDAIDVQAMLGNESTVIVLTRIKNKIEKAESKHASKQ